MRRVPYQSTSKPILLTLYHIKAFAKRKFAHDIESKIVTHTTHILRSTPSLRLTTRLLYIKQIEVSLGQHSAENTDLVEDEFLHGFDGSIREGVGQNASFTGMRCLVN
jgi:hypothetical protein